MAMGLKASHNLDEVLDAVDAWAGAAVEVAGPRTLNKLLDQAQVAGLRKISSIYQVGPRTMERYLTTKLASSGSLSATLVAKGAGFPLYLFSPRQVRGKKGGTRVRVKGRTFLIPHAFIARMRSGHVGVFARGAYGGKGKQDFTGERFGRFHFGKRRYSINELFTFGPPEALRNPEVTGAMNDRVEEQFGKVFEQEIRFATR